MRTLVRWQLVSLGNLFLTILLADTLSDYTPRFDIYHFCMLALLIPAILVELVGMAFLMPGQEKHAQSASCALFAMLAVPVSVYATDMPMMTGTLMVWAIVVAGTALAVNAMVKHHEKRSWPWGFAAMVVQVAAYHWAMRADMLGKPIAVVAVACVAVVLFGLGAKRWGGTQLALPGTC